MTIMGLEIVDPFIATQLLGCGTLMTNISHIRRHRIYFRNNCPNMVTYSEIGQGILFLCPKGLGNRFQVNSIKYSKNQNLLQIYIIIQPK